MQIRRHLAPAIVLAGLVSSQAIAAAEEPLPKAEDILDKFVEATGGKAAYEKVHNEMWTGTFEFVGKGIKGTATAYRAEPKKTLTTIELEGVGTIVEGTDGETAWTNSSLQGPRLKEGDEKAIAIREATFRGPIVWRKLYKQAEVTAVETVDGEPCYKVILTPNEGKPQTEYYAKKTNLMVKMVMTLASPMGEIPAETTLSDYQEQNGLRSPRKVHQKALGQEFLITIESVKYNIDLPKDRFDMPAEVKALVAKTDPPAK
jgi:hypothetical protein